MSGADVVIENQWSLWSPIVAQSGGEAVAAQMAVLNAGRQIKERLKLRSEPFRFRSSSAGTEFQAVGVAGTLAIKEVTIEIVPKFVHQLERMSEWDSATLFLLEALAGKHVISLMAERQQWKSHRVPDLIAHAFADSAERGLRDQCIHVYRQREESIPVMRGRLNLPRQLKNIFQAPHLYECDVDQLDAENSFNDVLKWAASALANIAQEHGLRERLLHIANALPGRTDRALGFRHARLHPPPQFQAWSDALELARLFASGMTMSSSGGRSNGYSLLFNMERAFEKFIEVGLGSAVKKLKDENISNVRQKWTIYAQSIDGGRPLGCRPDNVLMRSGTPVLVVDAKYKLLDESLDDTGSKTSPKSNDVYELLTATIANRCQAGLLVYPSSKGDEKPSLKIWNINAYGTTVRIGALSVDFMTLKSRVEIANAQSKLAEQIAAFTKGVRTPE